MSCQIIFLFDLDQCLPLEEKLDSENLYFYISQVKDVCSQILCAASHLDGPNLEHRSMAHFSFRFYSSTGYFLVPDKHGERLQYFNEDAFDNMDTALSEKFEALLQTSKTNSFKAEDLKQHIASSCGYKCHAVYMQKALEEIAVLFNWDRPLIHSPVKNHGKASVTNAIYLFTKLPRSREELGLFLGKPNSKRQFNHRDIQDKTFSSKSVLSILKGDAGVSINVVDTDVLRVENKMVVEDSGIKALFRKCLVSFKGNVLPLTAFCSDSCTTSARHNPYSALIVANSYIDQGDKPVARSFEVSLFWKGVVMKVLSSDEVPDVYVEKIVKDIENPMETPYSSYTLLWNGPHSIKKLCHFLLVKKCSAIIRCQEDLGIIKAIDETHLSLQITKDSETQNMLSAMITNSQENFRFKNRISLRSKNLKENPEKFFFRGSVFESSHIPDTSPFKALLEQNKAEVEKEEEQESDLIESLRRSYLPHSLDFSLRRKSSCSMHIFIR